MCITVLWAVKAFLLESRGAVGVMFVLKAIFVGVGGGGRRQSFVIHM